MSPIVCTSGSLWMRNRSLLQSRNRIILKLYLPFILQLRCEAQTRREASGAISETVFAENFYGFEVRNITQMSRQVEKLCLELLTYFTRFISNHTYAIASSFYVWSAIFFQITSATSFTLGTDEVAVIDIHLNLPVLGFIFAPGSAFVQVSKRIFPINVSNEYTHTLIPLWGDKVSMLTHIYPHKPWREIKWPYAKSPGWQPT